MTLCFTDECRKTRAAAAEAEAKAEAELEKKDTACSELPALVSKVNMALDGPAKHKHIYDVCEKAKECDSPYAKKVLEKYNGKDGNLGGCTVGGRKNKRKSRRKKTKKRRKIKRKSRRRKSRKTRRRRRRKSRR